MDKHLVNHTRQQTHATRRRLLYYMALPGNVCPRDKHVTAGACLPWDARRSGAVYHVHTALHSLPRRVPKFTLGKDSKLHTKKRRHKI